MAGPAVFTIPPHRGFADALAAGLIARTAAEPLGLARAIVILPSNRAALTVSEAFVRLAGDGLLLPRLVPIGGIEGEEGVAAAFDPADADPVPPAIDPLHRRMILARLICEGRAQAGDPVETGEALRLAADLARVIDQLAAEDVAPARLAEAVPAELSRHWERSLAVLRLILDRWPQELVAAGRLDPAERRNRLLRRTARAWRRVPPPGLVVAAGITATSPAIAELMGVIARLERGLVVLPGLDRAMREPEWAALGPDEAGRGIETHPQYALKLLIDRMSVARGEVRPWRHGGGGRAPAARSRAIGNALAPAAFTARWQVLKPADRRLTGVRAADFATPADEAQAIAIHLREAIEAPGRTAALVTPDRGLAARVSAHLRRWGIVADDTAGRPLAATPPGTLLLSLAEAAAEGFAPVATVALLKHPLVRAGAGRLDWLDGVRRLDRALRGPRPAPGLAGIAAHLDGGDEREAIVRRRAKPLWEEAAALLLPLETAFAGPEAPLPALLAAIREGAEALAGDAAWAAPAGRAAADLLAALEAAAPLGPGTIRIAAFPAILRQWLDEVAVRPPQGGHPRVAIRGLIEARLAQADVTVIGGLNEGVWPTAAAPDPWLAPALRSALGLPGMERRIGVQAHDLAGALGGGQVLVTRSRRDARAPTVASRFWLRMEAMTGGLTRAPRLARLAQAIDAPARFRPADRPAPRPPVEDRPDRIAVTRLDRLKADPFAFYASQMLRLSRWDAIDADPSAAWRGSAIHAVFEAWMREDDCRPDALAPRAEAMLAEAARHPVLRALWTPRLMEAIAWAGETVAAMRAEGRTPLVAEIDGATDIFGITLEGKVDRIDRLANGGLAIVDYKTGQPPAARAVAAGYAMQLGLLGLIAERGGFQGAEGTPERFEYWSLASAPRGGGLGHVSTPVGPRRGGEEIDPADFTTRAARILEAAVLDYLKGDKPFEAKLHPEHAPYDDYDQLMRLDEWYGRGAP
ncbi:MAG: double-strand break repair protein AddB [Sphingomonas fennica]